ncbi:MAG: hypothetical protein FWH33_00450 [Oscillospiraceae bacterium]|nr:hypothetical protein [Oscillospiraceae bacterium]
MNKRNRKKRSGLSRLLAILMTMALLAGIAGAALAADGSVSVTKTELGADGKQLDNIRTTTDVSAGSSTTMGNRNPGPGPDEGAAVGDYYVSTGHFTYVKQNLAELIAAPYGIDYDIVQGASFTKVGTANARIVKGDDGNDYLVITVGAENSTISGNWGAVAFDEPWPGGKHPHQGGGPLSHSNNGKTATISSLDINKKPKSLDDYGTFIYIYFHNQNTMTITQIYEEAVPFVFQLVEITYDSEPSPNKISTPVPITRDNIIFRKFTETGEEEVVYNGGGIGDDTKISAESSEDGFFWLKNGITATLCNLPAGEYEIIETTYEAYVTTIKPGGLGSVASITITEDGHAKVTFENARRPYELIVTKEINGTPLIPRAFDIRITFEGQGLSGIAGPDGSNGFSTSGDKLIWTGQITAGEDVIFSNLLPGMKYKVEEFNLPAGYELSTTSSGLEGKIEPGEGNDSYYSDPEKADSEVFFAKLVNDYSPVAELDLSARKTVSAGSPSTWSFNFEVYASDASGTQGAKQGATKTATNASPIVNFDTIGIKETGTYYYLIKEATVNGNGWTVDTKQYLVKVDVDSNLDITQKQYVTRTNSSATFGTAWTTYTDTSITFNNTYNVNEATLSLSGQKTTTAGAPNDTFVFNITNVTDPNPSNHTIIGTATRAGSGQINFSQLRFPTTGTYILEITEAEPAPGWASNTQKYTIYVRVTDNGRGQLSATAYTNAALTTTLTNSYIKFDNSFIADPTEMDFVVTKTITGDTYSSSWSFDFGLYESNSSGSQGKLLKTTSATDVDPVTSFDSVEFDSAGTYYFLIKETSANTSTWKVDPTIYHLRVTVSVINRSLSVSKIEFRQGRGSSFGSWNNTSSNPYLDSTITFNNEYTAPVPGSVSLTLSGTKTVSFGAPSEEFGFAISINTLGGEVEATATINGAGEFTFSPLSFIATGTYTFVVSESIWGPNWTPKTVAKTIYIEVTSTGGNLSAAAYSDSECLIPLTAEDLTFDNEYTMKVGYFDLALSKNISKIVSGTTVYDPPFGSLPTVKRGDKVTYTITITNEGYLDGYCEEIVDRIPAGLEFDPADNTDFDWRYDEATRCAYTNDLNAILLKPGDSKTVDITLTVSQTAAPGARLRNIAEINWHSDENHHFIDDEDSTPGNNVSSEDDEDNADVRVEGGDYTPPKTETEDEEEDEDEDDEEEEEVVEEEKGGGDEGGGDNGGGDRNDENDEEDDGGDDGGQPTIRTNPVIQDDGEETWVAGGTDINLPPVPTARGNTLTKSDDGDIWFEFDGDVPLGAWYWDDDAGMWIFDEYPPLADALPSTDGAIQISGLLLLGTLLLALGVSLKRKYAYKPKHLKRE